MALYCVACAYCVSRLLKYGACALPTMLVAGLFSSRITTMCCRPPGALAGVVAAVEGVPDSRRPARRRPARRRPRRVRCPSRVRSRVDVPARIPRRSRASTERQDHYRSHNEPRAHARPRARVCPCPRARTALMPSLSAEVWCENTGCRADMPADGTNLCPSGRARPHSARAADARDVYTSRSVSAVTSV